ncbi:NAD(P)/FAD-dependent oxidoreductase [Martelella soudanensis]|uniref:NAD(P)/FAD-dependent oxidoreductase n=1 Tax=unclassified Martelella TaxID=2629616 RepID=UPI0015DF2831|nr:MULTISPECIES: FAD-dependent oxidoreductase [unclassified Martelella]
MVAETSDTCVIVGASHAGISLASALRSAGWSAPIVVFGDENGLPYHRPHLSKEALHGDVEPKPLRPADFYDKQEIDRRRASVASIDRNAGRITLDDGSTVAYGKLVLATGAVARRLPDEIAGADKALLLRNRTDWRQLVGNLSTAERIAIIGGGLIGLEIAAAAQIRGLAVTVCENADRLMVRSLYPAMSTEVRDRHVANGIDIRLSASVRAISDSGLEMADGEHIDADVVLAATGSRARDELARNAGLATDDGVITSACGATADPSIYALGDCARWREGRRHVRHESVAATLWQAKCVAAALMRQDNPVAEPLRLWSNQGAIRIQMAGPVVAGARVEVERLEHNGMLLRAYEGDRLLAVQTLDAPRAFASEVSRLSALGREPAAPSMRRA